jgi:hypothetical protein
MRRKSTPCTTGREEIGLFAWQLQSGSAHGDENASQTITAGRWIRGSTAFCTAIVPKCAPSEPALIYVNAAFCGVRAFTGNKAG